MRIETTGQTKTVIEVPDEGALPPIPDDVTRNYLDCPRIQRCYMLQEGGPPLEALTIELAGGQPATVFGTTKTSSSNSLDLIRVPTRREWVALYVQSSYSVDLRVHSEDGLTPWGGVPDDDGSGGSDTYRGPFAVDDYCRQFLPE